MVTAIAVPILSYRRAKKENTKNSVREVTSFAKGGN